MSSTSNTQRISEDDDNATLADLSIASNDIQTEISKNWPSLDPQYRAFAHEYVINGYNHRAAAKRAGINPKSGLKTVRKPLVSAYISYLQNNKLDSSIVQKDFIDARLDDLFEMAIGNTKVNCITSDGASFRAKKFEGKLALQIIQEKSKMNNITKPDIDGGSILDAFAAAVRGNVPTDTSNK